jgi:hypothetical protein
MGSYLSTYDEASKVSATNQDNNTTLPGDENNPTQMTSEIQHNASFETQDTLCLNTEDPFCLNDTNNLATHEQFLKNKITKTPCIISKQESYDMSQDGCVRQGGSYKERFNSELSTCAWDIDMAGFSIKKKRKTRNNSNKRKKDSQEKEINVNDISTSTNDVTSYTDAVSVVTLETMALRKVFDLKRW